ncbi:MAG TPA: cob(I)yrinic acid a,c-diamide adenosyltransferase [Chloroflexota bacterium]|nr:cob(I)yrinic acid a,c-diamide adenosyltransferase [Chloroflexota bacterium]
MKIYTKAGDAGETALFGGLKVAKDVPRVEAYGTVDELNACLGLAVVAMVDQPDIHALLFRTQSELFDLGAELSTPPERAADRLAARVPLMEAARVEALEREIDQYEEELPPLKTFILPGGTPASAALHLARTICRRAERRVITLAAREDVNPEVVRYLNRLSDLLFVLARVANRRAGCEDVPWRMGAGRGAGR